MRLLQRTIAELEEDRPDSAHAGIDTLGVANARAWQPVRDEIIETLHDAYAWDRREGDIVEAAAFVPRMLPRLRAPGLTGEAWYLPRHRTIALFQSALDEYLDRKSADDVTALTWSSAEQFDVRDPLWISFVLQKLRALRRGRAVFPRHESTSDFRFQIEDSTRIALVSDWGSGNDSARAVSMGSASGSST